jgi:hypothetical protein
MCYVQILIYLFFLLEFVTRRRNFQRRDEGPVPSQIGGSSHAGRPPPHDLETGPGLGGLGRKSAPSQIGRRRIVPNQDQTIQSPTRKDASRTRSASDLVFSQVTSRKCSFGCGLLQTQGMYYRVSFVIISVTVIVHSQKVAPPVSASYYYVLLLLLLLGNGTQHTRPRFERRLDRKESTNRGSTPPNGTEHVTESAGRLSCRCDGSKEASLLLIILAVTGPCVRSRQRQLPGWRNHCAIIQWSICSMYQFGVGNRK